MIAPPDWRPSRRGALRAAVTVGAGMIGSDAIAFALAGPDNGDADVAVDGAVSHYIAGSGTSDLPEPIALLGRLHILDTLAAIVACQGLAAARVGRNYALAQSGGATRNAATILGTRHCAALVDAAFAGAMAGHAAEINDFIPSALVQPGPAVVSAAFALAETRGKSGREVLRAVIAGYELTGRITKALGVGNLQKTPLASHGIGPTFGTAAAAASLADFNPAQVSTVLSACAQQVSGSWQWALDTDHVEKAFVFAGTGARNGLQAALLVEAGYTGVPSSLDAKNGWMRSSAFEHGDANRRYLIDGLGSRFEISETGFKRYPSGGPTQPSVEAMLRLLPMIDRTKVQRITIAMPGNAETFQSAALPALNLRYLAAIIVIDGKLDFQAAQSRERMANDPAVRGLMARVDVVRDAAQEALPGQARPESARVTVVAGNQSRSLFIPFVRGYPSHPMTRVDVEDKARGLMTPMLGNGRSEEIVSRILSLEKQRDVSAIIRLLAPSVL